MRAFVNTAVRPAAVAAPSSDAAVFHAALPGYRPTPVHGLPAAAAELGLGAVALKDESDRLGLPAFKVLGASWAVENAVREQPGAGRAEAVDVLARVDRRDDPVRVDLLRQRPHATNYEDGVHPLASRPGLYERGLHGVSISSGAASEPDLRR